MEINAKEALILKLFRAFPGAENKISRAVVNEYLDAMEGFSVKAVARAVAQFRDGLVERDSHAFVPKVPELSIVARRCQEIEDMLAGGGDKKVVPYALGAPVPEGCTPLGPTKVNFGRGTIDMSRMSHEEKEEVLRNKGLPKPGGVVPQIRRM